MRENVEKLMASWKKPYALSEAEIATIEKDVRAALPPTVREILLRGTPSGSCFREFNQFSGMAFDEQRDNSNTPAADDASPAKSGVWIVCAVPNRAQLGVKCGDGAVTNGDQTLKHVPSGAVVRWPIDGDGELKVIASSLENLLLGLDACDRWCVETVDRRCEDDRWIRTAEGKSARRALRDALAQIDPALTGHSWDLGESVFDLDD